MDKKSKFLLLQVNDALFPIGGYSHSYGLETYIKNLSPMQQRQNPISETN